MSVARRLAPIVSLLAAMALAGCAARPAVPPVHSAGAQPERIGKFVWYDLLTEDVPAVKRFYGELLGWSFAPTDAPNYQLIENDGVAIGGVVDMVGIGSDANESQWISLLSVADVDAAVRATLDAGGVAHVAPRDLAGRGRIAVVGDGQGAIVGLLRSSVGDPPDRSPRPGDWFWTELWAADVERATEFYGDLVGYAAESKTILDDIEYDYFSRDGVPRAGIIHNPFPADKVRDNWMPYVLVEDAGAVASRVEDLGGKIVIPADEKIRGGTVAVVIDPSGAALALQEKVTK